MFKLSNDHLSVSIQAKGAELKSLCNKNTGIEYMWNGDPAFWGKTSPVLFPIVGSLKEDTFIVKGKSYRLGRHGFARDMDFLVKEQDTGFIQFMLSSTQHTLEKYPYPFLFEMKYQLAGDQLLVTYRITNTGKETMFFSVGGHPAFKVPLVPGTEYTDYFLEFEKEENAGRWPLTDQGLLEEKPQPLLNNTSRLPLTRELFLKDAIVLRNLQSTSVKLLSGLSPHGLSFDFSGFPYLGIWAAPLADFVCIEPWCGVTDGKNTSQQLTEKEGIQELKPGEVFERCWKVNPF